MKKIYIVMGLCLLLITGCGTNTTEGTLDEITFKETEETTNYVKIVTNKNDIILIELLPEYAPITVENFQYLVGEDFYDGLIFHRISTNFVIQGGDPDGNGTGGSSQTIKGEFEENGVDNDLSHERGIVSMARSNDFDSASSQFFICLSDLTCEQLNGSYASFGKVIAGMETVDEIALSQLEPGTETPIQDIVMKDVSFVTINK